MLSLIGRLLSLLLWLPLLVSRPFLRLGSRSRRARAARARAERRSVERARTAQVKSGPVDETAVRAAAPGGERLHAMLAELARVLNAEETHRHEFRYLARFERKLREGGLAAMEQVQVKELRRALRDFEGLVRNWSQPELADLRSRMSVTLNDRSSAASVWITANSVTSEWKPSRDLLAAHAAAIAATGPSSTMRHT